MANFKVGDKVECMTPDKDDIESGYIKGNIYTVSYVHKRLSETMIDVEELITSIYAKDVILYTEPSEEKKEKKIEGWGY